MRWVSDDGLVEVERDGGGVTAKVPGHDRVSLQKVQGRAWMGKVCVRGGGVDTVIVVESTAGEVLVGLIAVRPLAAGTEADPRCLDREWRCARVIEDDET